jgi:1-deoxy-D-xylulose-5-phosphate reductoisomerase
LPKRLVILGSTGSIGTQTLDVVRRASDRLAVVGLSAHHNQALLGRQAAEFDVPSARAVCGDPAALAQLAALPEADLVVVAVAGAAGIEATLAALEAGKDVALATKEVLVAAGALVMDAARRSGARILPIDSEHSAIFQCVAGEREQDVAEIWLTASGGPFRQMSAAEIEAATVESALKHPTWPSMGRKITVDSATLMNKGLEAIEAMWLFGLPIDRIKILVHPQSLIHGMVQMRDGSVLAQIGLPDMRLPIQYALLTPERTDTGLPRLTPAALSALTFEEADAERFPCLGLARRAAEAGGTMPAAMNAANESAVAAFLDGRGPLGLIPKAVANAMSAHVAVPKPDLETILAADRNARAFVTRMLETDAGTRRP